jgi:class 3 adenylate cyclase
MVQALEDPLAAGLEAMRRHAWIESYDLLQKADRSTALAPEHLEVMAEAAWWAARPDECIDALERAYAMYLEAGHPTRAGYVALCLAREYGSKRASSVAAGWFRRAESLFQSQPECKDHGFYFARRSVAAENQGNFHEAIQLAQHALEIGMRFGDRDVQAYGLLYKGMCLVEKGEVAEGMALIDEATVAAVGGELSPYATGIVYCNTISICRDIADYRRAGDWTEAAHRWCGRQAISGFPGICRVHRAEVMAFRGDWPEAEHEAHVASQELVRFNWPGAAGEGFYQIGEIRLKMGDLVGAEEAFRQAHELGRDPQPGLSLLHLSRGKLDEAESGIRVALVDESWNRLARARLLPAQVEIGLQAGDVELARAASEELTAIAEAYRSPTLHATAHVARGAVLVKQGSPEEAISVLGQGVRHFLDVEAPYEAARARKWLAEAHRAGGDTEGAILELRTARSVFERLGAAGDLRETDEMLARLAPTAGERTPARTTFMFTDLVKSTNLIEAIGDDSWYDLLRWHDQTLRECFKRHNGEEVDHAGDGFFVVFPDPGAALECAVGMQRLLAEHRRTHGFSPQVRIGIHTAEATRVGRAYRGKAVHEAARLAALAEGGEILATRQSVDGIEDALTLSDPRHVALKGITSPVEVVSIEWRPR